MEKKYKALRTIGSIFKILGIIAGILTLLVVIGLCATSILGGAVWDSFGNELGYSGGGGMFSGVVGGLMLSFFAILNGGGLALSFYAMGEGLFILIALEENTRTTAELLRQQSRE